MVRVPGGLIIIERCSIINVVNIFAHNVMALTLKMAVVQTPSEPDAFHLDTVGNLVCAAARQGAQLVLLPELFASPFHFDVPVWQWGTPRDGKVEQFLCSTAKSAGIYLGGSYLEARGDNFFNTFALASPAGEVVGRVGKAHPCSLEACVFAPAPGPQVIVTELGRIGVAICYDNSLRDVVDRLLADDPDLWLLPMSAPTPPLSLSGAKGKQAYLDLLRLSPVNLARHFGIPFAMANKSGSWHTAMPGWLPAVDSSFPGLSRIANSDGELLVALDGEVGFAVAEVMLDPARKQLTLPPAFEAHRPWIDAPSLDFRLFPLFEWWGRRYYRRHPERPAIAHTRSACHE